MRSKVIKRFAAVAISALLILQGIYFCSIYVFLLNYNVRAKNVWHTGADVEVVQGRQWVADNLKTGIADVDCNELFLKDKPGSSLVKDVIFTHSFCQYLIKGRIIDVRCPTDGMCFAVMEVDDIKLIDEFEQNITGIALLIQVIVFAPVLYMLLRRKNN